MCEKSIYGLKQSPRCWNSTLDAYLKEMQFTQTASDPCIYYRKTGKEDTAENDYQLIVKFSEVSEIEMDHDITQPEQVQESSPLELRRFTRTRKQPDYYSRESSNVYEV